MPATRHNAQSWIQATPDLVGLPSREGLDLTAYSTPITTQTSQGQRDMLSQYNVPVFGPAHESIHGTSRESSRKATKSKCRASACGHAYSTFRAIPRSHRLHGDGVLFCGETLFSCGCGRLFEGHRRKCTLSSGKLASLPTETRCTADMITLAICASQMPQSLESCAR